MNAPHKPQLSRVPRMIPCPDCCTPNCVVESDDFNRADSTSIGGDWTEVSGDWEIVSNKLWTDDSSAVVVHDTTNPATGGMYIKADVTCASTSDAARIIGKYTDSSNYWFAEAQPGATDGTLKIFERVIGSNTQRGRTVPIIGFTAGDTITLEFCISEEGSGLEDRVWARVGGVRTGFSPLSIGTITGTKVGMGTGGSSTDVEFDNFEWQEHFNEDSACPSCGTHCIGQAGIDDQIQLDFTGFSNTGSTCFNCTGLNATFVLDAVSGEAAMPVPLDGTIMDCCYWINTTPSSAGCAIGFGSEIIAGVHIISGEYFLIVRVRTADGTGFPRLSAEFRLSLGTGDEPDLSALSATNIPLTTSSTGGIGICRSTGATCTATFIPS